ncbi:MAG TPA: PAS domain-containing protein, partial [Acidimicrobiales bacterium]|nr:PAS domain-containing protein [Acidimicrobiales bacterium]
MGDQGGTEPTPVRSDAAPAGRRLRAETKDALLAVTAGLLGAPEVMLTAERPLGALSSPLELPDRRLWLSVSTQGRTEPFGDADREMLGALAELGAWAVANAERYAEAKQRYDDLAVITDSIGEGVCIVDAMGRITFMNGAGARLLGWPEGSVGDGAAPEGRATPRFLLDPARRAMALRQTVVSEDTRFERADGTHFPASLTASPVAGEPEPPAAVLAFRDASERRAFEDQLARHAFSDPLTRLANRRLLVDHLDHALLQAQRSGTRV